MLLITYCTIGLVSAKKGWSCICGATRLQIIFSCYYYHFSSGPFDFSRAMLPSPRFLGLVLEWSCHAVPWFIFSGGWILGLLISNMAPPPCDGPNCAADPYVVSPRTARNLYGWRAACLLFVLILDVLVVGCLKFIVRRPRPEANYAGDMLLTVSIDDWSFPSGEYSIIFFGAVYFNLV